MSDSPTPPPAIRSLNTDGDAVVIEWSDGVQHRLTWRLLRAVCPCATCRTQPSGPPPPQDDLRATAMQPMGNYAYQIDFSDGHNIGIYSLEFLRKVGEEAAEADRRE